VGAATLNPQALALDHLRSLPPGELAQALGRRSYQAERGRAPSCPDHLMAPEPLVDPSAGRTPVTGSGPADLPPTGGWEA